ncbi:hypothetical protein SCOCK_870014 [Actinacidiphila cocklensis]|uniref:Uncharacterized protein n=1 Tax=Actinacidiphila cocklensis TaxID=887465 RepID=A0A9W4DZ58_9ACTN|nr:hypothetical protein SCOCK_870014 [Actinacidiphila cocklensis]
MVNRDVWEIPLQFGHFAVIRITAPPPRDRAHRRNTVRLPRDTRCSRHGRFVTACTPPLDPR